MQTLLLKQKEFSYRALEFRTWKDWLTAGMSHTVIPAGQHISKCMTYVLFTFKDFSHFYILIF
jgi:hypothetical protein